FRHVRGDLFEGRVGKRVELHFHYRAETTHGHADSGTDDARLGQRCVEAAVLAEIARQPVGDAEYPAEGADVLATHQDVLVVFHRVPQRRVERVRHRG